MGGGSEPASGGRGRGKDQKEAGPPWIWWARLKITPSNNVMQGKELAMTYSSDGDSINLSRPLACIHLLYSMRYCRPCKLCFLA